MAKQIEKKDVNRVIEIKTKGNQTPLEASTEYLLKPSFLAASVIDSNKQQLSKDHIDLQYTHAMLEKSLVDIKKGGLADVEEVLYTQACALNMMFSTLVMRANKQEYMSNLQTYMSLAFKAQNQSRTTLQALVDMKQPNQTAFIKQANIAHGHQQVNNFPEKNHNPQNELLEKVYDLDSPKKAKTKGINPDLETMEPVNGGKDAGR